MIVNLHDNDRGNPGLCPGVIAPGLAEAVAGDFSRQADGSGGHRHDPPCLHPADGLLVFSAIRKHILPVSVREVFFECGDSLLIEGDGFLFPGLLLGQRNVGAEATCFKIIDIRPLQLQKVADPERRTGTQHD